MKYILLLAAATWCLSPQFAKSQVITIPIEFTTASESVMLVIGTDPNATDDFDADIDVFAPPSPPFNGLYVYSTINEESFQSDFRDTTSTEKIFHISYSGNEGNSIVLRWDPAALAGMGIFEITDDGTGTDFGPFDMTATDSLDTASAGGMLNEGLRIRILLGEETGTANEVADGLPAAFVLEQNFPNPFSSQTEIRFETTRTEYTRLVVYDVLGKELAVLIDQPTVPGSHSVTWDASDLPNGVYFYTLTTGTSKRTMSMTLFK